VDGTHGFAFHGVHEPGAVHEIGETAAIRIEESSQKFRRHSQVRIQNGEYIAGRILEPQTDSIGFSPAGLLKRFEAKSPAIGIHDALDFFPGSVAGMTFDENDLNRSVE